MKIPEDHDCKKNGCFTHEAELGLHYGMYGLCLACGGCFDPECCTHDYSCYYEPRIQDETTRQNSNTVEESQDT